MPSWNDVLSEIKAAGSTHDLVRRRYLRELHETTGRNVIIYYSGWLQKPQVPGRFPSFSVNDADKDGFMATIHQMDRSAGLDLVLHTPGGDVAATESIVQYLRAMFDNDVRVIVPQLALSAGTMIALASKRIVMGKHSSLGPIDPQIAGMAAHGVVEEFQKAIEETKRDPSLIPIWQPIIAKYQPTLIGECEKAIKWANEMAREWLKTGMFAGEPDASDRAEKVLGELADHALTLAHNRHISADKALDLGLDVERLEDDDAFQEKVLTVHHATIQTLAEHPAVKIIENHLGVAHISSLQLQ